MRTTEELVAVAALVCAACVLRVRGGGGGGATVAPPPPAGTAARTPRQVYETGAEADLSWNWNSAEPLAYEPNTQSLRRADILPSRPQPYYRLEQIFTEPLFAASSTSARTRISNGLLTFGTPDPDPRLRGPLPILIVRQLPVEAFLDGSRPPPPPPPPPGASRVTKSGGGLLAAAGLLTFGAPSTPTPTTTPPLPWWRNPPPVQVAVRPRLTESAAETLAVGSSPLVARLHGPIAMGSGGVGYARLADGRLAIGSGSIGFAQFDVISLGSFV